MLWAKALLYLLFYPVSITFFYISNIQPTSGTIQAFQQVAVGVHFTAVKPLTLKKTLRIEATDLDNGSTVQTESVVVSAESYNAVIDVSKFLKLYGMKNSIFMNFFRYNSRKDQEEYSIMEMFILEKKANKFSLSKTKESILWLSRLPLKSMFRISI